MKTPGTLLNETQRFTTVTNDGIPADFIPITISELPLINLVDLTKKSANFFKINRLNGPEDLESDLIPDGQLDDQDLYLIEKEVNKRTKKRFKAQQNNLMMSASSPVNT